MPDPAEQPESIERVEDEVVPGPTASHPDELAPNPLGHAAPDVELADAQLAIGRAEIDQGREPIVEADGDIERFDGDTVEDEDEEGFGGDYEGPPGGGASLATAGGGELGGAGVAVAERRAGLLSRLIAFLQGSWRELQRVQWPDRRQVAQATGVVLGFVIVAGVFLGVADLLSTHLMNYILNGHW